MTVLAIMCIMAGTGLVFSVYLLGLDASSGTDGGRSVSRFPKRKIPVHTGVFRSM